MTDSKKPAVRTIRPRTIVVHLCTACVLAATWGYRWMYPYGSKCCIVPQLWIGLVSYAANNEDSFPDDPSGSLAALSKLYPDYFKQGDEYVLAGLSGDIDEARRSLGNAA